MPLAKEIAAELRRIADVLDLNPEVKTIKPELSFFHYSSHSKDEFMAVARIMPRPLEKKYPKTNESYSRVEVKHSSSVLDVTASIYRESICRIIKPAQPAEYDCELTLLDSEDSALAGETEGEEAR